MESPRPDPSVPALFDRLVDYAGLFPPASLPLAEAVVEYRALLDRSDAGLLGRFIVPASRLDELTVFLRLFSVSRPLRLALLAPPGPHAPDMGAAVAYARVTGDAFVDASGGRVRIECFETRASERELDVPATLAASLRRAAESATPRPVYAELPFARRPEDAFAALERIADVRAEGHPLLAAKVRCGGEGPDDVPSTATLARFLARCAALDIPFKATAGLHHPLRHERTDGGTAHGFLNVFAAAVLARSGRLDPATIARVIEERDPAAFSLSDGGISWQGRSASADATALARSGFAHAFGSCSFDEPTDDLRALGWLDPLPVPAA